MSPMNACPRCGTRKKRFMALFCRRHARITRAAESSDQIDRQFLAAQTAQRRRRWAA